MRQTYGIKIFFIFLALLIISDLTIARPKIGLALGGGGAKGGAHIGVLKVLKEHNIPIDYIAGTSIGSVIGAMYATGLTVEEIEKIMFESPWGDGYSDSIPRENLPWRIKQQSNQFNIPLEMGISEHQLKIPSGLLYGQSATKILRQAFGEHPNFISFNDLAIPFRAIATDLVNYEPITIDKGSLITALRASTGVPGALAPEEINGLLLVDGGITKNLPIDVVRAMGADIIIAVDIGSELQKKEELGSTLSIIDQLSSFLTNNNTVAQKEKLSKLDFLIKPDIEGLSTTDWSIVQESLKRGENAANQQSKELSSLSIDKESYNDYLLQLKEGRNRLLTRIEKPINSIILSKQSNISDALILNKLNLEAKNTLDATSINEAIDRIYSIDEFQRVEANTLIHNDDKTLHIAVEEKSWGPNFLEFGIGWEDDLDNNSDLNFDIAYTLGNLTRHGGELRSELEMGTARSFDTEFYMPLNETRDFYSSSRYIYKSFAWNIYVENNPLIPIEQHYHSISQGLGYNYIQEGFLEIGITAEQGEFYEPILLEGSINYFTYGSYFKFGFDTLDSINFPTQGTYVNFSSFLRNEDVEDHSIIKKDADEGNISSLTINLNWKSAIKLGNHAFVGKAAYSETFTENNNESIYTSFLGGFLNLSGYHKNALVGAKKALGAGIYQFDLGRSILNMNQYPLYIGLSLETGNVWQQGEEIHHKDFIVSSSVYFGIDTALGPVAFGFGNADNHVDTFYFYLGKNF